jgi:hypothetical protein
MKKKVANQKAHDQFAPDCVELLGEFVKAFQNIPLLVL